MSHSRFIIFLLLSQYVLYNVSGAFLATMPITGKKTPTFLCYSPNYEEVLYQRLHDLRRNILEKERFKPPNPNLDPIPFVKAILESLIDPDDPLPDSGLRRLLRASTPAWQNKLKQSIGAASSSLDCNEDVVASALGAALSRPHNQFAILMGNEEDYIATFPSEAVDFLDDGKCWIECQLRSKEEEGRLLVMTGWHLQKGKDGAWLVDGLDWQDFRDAYRPGIGREEWMRICG